MEDDGVRRGDVGSDLNLSGVERCGEAEGQERLRLLTDAGAVECRWHPAPAGDAAVLWVFGAGGGLGGPAGGLYTRLGQRLRPPAASPRSKWPTATPDAWGSASGTSCSAWLGWPARGGAGWCWSAIPSVARW